MQGVPSETEHDPGPNHPHPTMISVAEPTTYPTQPAPLRRTLQMLLREATPPAIGDAAPLAIIAPDSNALAAGSAAASAYAALAERSYDVVAVVAPSLSSTFQRIHVSPLEAYRTPLGDVPVSDRVRNELCDEDDDIFVSDEGLYHPRGADAQLPFLQHQLGAFEVVPVVMGEASLALCRELGNALGEVSYSYRTLMVACVEVLAAEPEALRDLRAALEELDAEGIARLLRSPHLEVLGGGPLLATVIATSMRRARTTTLTHMPDAGASMPGYLAGVIHR